MISDDLLRKLPFRNILYGKSKNVDKVIPRLDIEFKKFQPDNLPKNMMPGSNLHQNPYLHLFLTNCEVIYSKCKKR